MKENKENAQPVSKLKHQFCLKIVCFETEQRIKRVHEIEVAQHQFQNLMKIKLQKSSTNSIMVLCWFRACKLINDVHEDL